jgi:aminoglycoside phosphotransferase
MIELSRKPYAYGTSHRLDEVVIESGDGKRVTMLRKDLTPAAKPEFLHDSRRERVAYQILDSVGLGTPVCHGSGDDWLLIEKVDGVELWQVGDLRTWADAARWLGRFHRHFEQAPPRDACLLRYQRAYFEGWWRRAAERHPDINDLAPFAERAIEILAADQSTFVHGEFYASNILAADDRIAPVDWEMAGLGSGMIDLAALVSGWDDDSRMAMLAAYGGVREKALAAAELQIAVQWLGWSDSWVPPLEHRRDWIAEARAAVGRLGL